MLDKDFLKSFSDVVREQITRNDQVKLQDIGTFYREHRVQHQQQYQNGRVVMMPPEDVIQFTPHK